MKTFGKCKWSNIRVGEVFAVYEDKKWYIEIKVKTKYNQIAPLILSDTNSKWAGVYDLFPRNIYRLSLADQKNWIEQ